VLPGEIRLWAPDQDTASKKGYIVNVDDGWGGEVNDVRGNSASVRIRFYDCFLLQIGSYFLFLSFPFLYIIFLLECASDQYRLENTNQCLVIFHFSLQVIHFKDNLKLSSRL